MEQYSSLLQDGFSSLISILGTLLGGILLVLVAWIVATILKKVVAEALGAANLDSKLVDWGFANSQQQGDQTVNSLAQVVYYLVWVLFLPGIFQAFGLNSIGQPIANMIDTALAYLPNLIGAIVIVILGIFAAKFVRNLVYNFLVATNVDSYLNRFVGDSNTNKQSDHESKRTLSKALASLVYFLVLLPILLVAVETLGIESIGRPITQLLNTILSAIPNILVAMILLGVGFVVAKVVGDLLVDLLKGTGVNKYSATLREKANVDLDLAQVIGQAVAVIIGLLFFVEALNALNLGILNAVGAAIIAYIPSVIVAGIIALVAFALAEFLASLINRSTSSNLAAGLVKALVYVFAGFMILDQLNFASGIVNQAFFLVIGAIAVAFALAFGLGGRDFARKQLEKADNKIDEESSKMKNQ